MTTFQVDVSRTYRNKEGYKVGGYKLNTSFHTETHNPNTFIEQVVKPGWPYTMVHLKRSPQETGAAARGVSTPKHIENFVSRQELTGDDDSQAPVVVDFWLNEPWFSQHGFAFVESVNSIPGEAEKGHPTIILDRPITDPVIYKAAAKALAWRYPRLDSGIHNIDRTIYNAQGARVHLLGNICQWETFNREILQPYLAHLAEEQARAEARRQQLQAEREELPASDDRLEEYARRSIQGILHRLATARDGERHNITRWAGVALGALKAADWVKPGSLDYIQEDVLKAAQQAGGYDDAEILRTFEWGFTTGQGKPTERPTFYEPAQAGKVKNNNIHLDSALQPEEENLAAPRGPSEVEIAWENFDRKLNRTPQHAADQIPFIVIDEADYIEVMKHRATIRSAAEWLAIVLQDYPELDPDEEYRRKIRENKEARKATCGTPFKRFTADGRIVEKHILCGMCDYCRRIDAGNIRRKLESYMVTKGEDITLLKAYSKEERRTITSTCKVAGVEYQVFPVRDGKDNPVYYDILVLAHVPNSGTVLDPLLITEQKIFKWLDTPEKERKSGELVGNIRQLREEFREKDDDECSPDDPDAVELLLPGVITKSEMAAPLLDEEVSDPDDLQEALFEAHRRYVDELTKQKHTLGVTIKKIYTPREKLPEIMARFNQNRVRKKPTEEPDPTQMELSVS